MATKNNLKARKKRRKMLGPKMGYVELLNEATKDYSANSNWNAYMPLRPSSAGQCARKLAYDLYEHRGKASYEKEVQQPNITRLLKLGHTIEREIIYDFAKLKDYLGEFNIKYKQQVLSFFSLPATGEWIEGSIDSVFVSGKHKALIDYKTKKDKFDHSFKSHWDATEDTLIESGLVTKFGEDSFWVNNLVPFIDWMVDEMNDTFWAMNFMQLNMYFFDEAKFLRNRGIDHAALIYYNKNDSRMREIRFRPEKELYDRVKKKFLLVSAVIDNDGVPEDVPKTFTLRSPSCAFCDRNEDCWNGNEKQIRKEFFKTLPNKRWAKDSYEVGQQAEVLEELYNEFKLAKEAQKDYTILEAQIVKILDDAKLWKVRFGDGKIYDVKQYKKAIKLKEGK